MSNQFTIRRILGLMFLLGCVLAVARIPYLWLGAVTVACLAFLYITNREKYDWNQDDSNLWI